MINSLLSEMFSQILDEDSTAMSAVRQSPYADQLIKAVHKSLAMPHDVRWEKVAKVSWNDIKARSPNYVLIAGTEGTAAIRWSGTYEALVSYNEGITQHQSDSVNGIMAYIKAGIGKTTGFWEATDQGKTSWGRRSSNRTGDVETIRKNRKDARTVAKPNVFDPAASNSQNFKALLRKLRPLYMRYLDQAIADIKGAAAISIKNDAFQRAQHKLQRAEQLQNLQYELENNPDPEEMPEKINKALRNAVWMTAGYFYPEKTGSIERARGQYHHGQVQNPEGARQVIADIANGDQEKMVTIMQFFKQDLLH